MKLMLLPILLLSGQLHSSTARKVVHLVPAQTMMTASFGGKELDLIHSPGAIYLPESPPRSTEDGLPWYVEIKNLGPAPVTISGKIKFQTKVAVGATVKITSTGRGYLLSH